MTSRLPKPLAIRAVARRSTLQSTLRPRKLWGFLLSVKKVLDMIGWVGYLDIRSCGLPDW